MYYVHFNQSVLGVVPYLVSFTSCKDQRCPVTLADGGGGVGAPILCSHTSTYLYRDASLIVKGTSLAESLFSHEMVSSYGIVLETRERKQMKVDSLVELWGVSFFHSLLCLFLPHK